MPDSAANRRGDAVVMALFFVQPLAFGNWLTRIPDVQLALGLGPSGLALALMGLPIGIVVTLPFAGRLVARIGPRASFLLGFPLYLALLTLPPLARSPMQLFLTLLLAGAALSSMELSLNVAADQHEAATSRRIMHACHGCWALGIMTGSLLGVALASLPAWLAVVLGAGAMLPVSLWVSASLPRRPVLAAGATGKLFNLPTKSLAWICAFVFGTTITEGAVADWSALYLRQAADALPATSGLGYTAFSGFLAAGRFGGDRLNARFGPRVLGRVAMVVALLGLVLVVAGTGAGMMIAGFGVMGLGVSVGFPLSVTAAGALGDQAAAINIAALSQVALFGFVVGPPLIGFIAEATGLRLGLASLLPLLVVSTVAAGYLRGRLA